MLREVKIDDQNENEILAATGRWDRQGER